MSRGRSQRERRVPFVPLDGGVADKGPELFWEGTAGEGDSESALFLDGLLLCFEDESSEGFLDVLGGGKGKEDWRTRRMVHLLVVAAQEHTRLCNYIIRHSTNMYKL